jgi:hypothetical protein
MSSRRSFIALLALAALLAFALGHVFQRRVARDLYPVYSSFRADPLGTRALHDALAAVPGLTVDRSLVPLARLSAQPERTLLLLGVQRYDLSEVPSEDFAALDGALRSGSRVILCLKGINLAPTTELENDASARDELKKTRQAADQARKKTAKKPDDPDDESVDPAREEPAKQSPTKPAKPKHPPVDALARWGFSIEEQRDHSDLLTNRPAAPVLPTDFRWGSALVIKPVAEAPWHPVIERDGAMLVAERSIGLGTLVVATDAYAVSNEALQRERATEFLCWLIGPHRHVVFDESHLGVLENPGIAALARRYGLMPAFALCGLLALLFIWRRAAAFVPPPPAGAITTLDYRPTSSLTALLRRALPAAQLLPTCLAEWRRTARAGDLARVEAALGADTDPVTGYNAAVAALRRRATQKTERSAQSAEASSSSPPGIRH